MTLLAPWFLAGLAALAPLIALHLRRRRREQDVASLLLWRDLPGGAAPRRRSTRLVLPLLLLLQALFVVLLVLALARPGDDGGPRAGAAGLPPAVFVLDGSTRMAMTDVAPDRLAGARAELDRRLGRLPASTPVSVVIAGATPRLVAAAVSPDDARAAVDGVHATAPDADLPAGLALASGQLHRPGGTVTLIRAAGDPAPHVRTAGVAFADVTIGGPADNQRLERPVARCAPAGGFGAATTCSVFAVVRNEAKTAVRERVTVRGGGSGLAARELTIGAGASAELSLAAAPGARLTLALTRPDALAADDRAVVDVPAAAAPVAVTLVSRGPATEPLARALAAVPGVTLRRVAPARYTAAAARTSDLLVLEGFVPPGDTLPAARTLLLVAPPRLPGGRVGAALDDATPSGAEPGARLLRGVDLSGLAVGVGGARRIVLPPSLPAIAWAPGGPLLAAGDAGDIGDVSPRRVAVLALDPQRSNLPQLPAFPVLVGNVVAWSAGRLPAASTPVASTTTAVTLRAGDGGAPTPGHRQDWWPWLVAAALLVLAAEWAYPWLAERSASRTAAPR